MSFATIRISLKKAMPFTSSRTPYNADMGAQLPLFPKRKKRRDGKLRAKTGRKVASSALGSFGTDAAAA